MAAQPSVPHSPAVIDTHQSAEALQDCVRAVCREILAGWADLVGTDGIAIEVISGGITNILLKAR